jgi:hypothetical protein
MTFIAACMSGNERGDGEQNSSQYDSTLREGGFRKRVALCGFA